MKTKLDAHVKANGKKMYGGVSKHIKKGLRNLNETLKPRLLTAASDTQKTILDTIKNIITSSEKEQLDPIFAKVVATFKQTIEDQIHSLEDAWAKDLKNPEIQLKAANPFMRNRYADEGDEDEGSEVESEDWDMESHAQANDDFNLSDSDNDSEVDDAEKEDVDMEKANEAKSLFVFQVGINCFAHFELCTPLCYRSTTIMQPHPRWQQ